MKGFHRSCFAMIVLLSLGLDGAAQTSTFRQIISTYVGPPLPVSGTEAITQVIDSASNPISDGNGGFYFVSLIQNRVYRVKSDGTLLVIAGTGGVGFNGDGGPAIAAELNFPTGIALDAQGNLFIADLGNDRVRKVSSAGIISTVAGTGAVGSDGDGGLATSARVNPFGLAVDSAGNLFISEIDNNRVRKINPAGIISTVAGTGTRGFGGDNGPAVSAQLTGPKSIVLDSSGNLFIADTFNSRIRKVTPNGIISTVAGTGVKGFSGDEGAATSAQLSWPSGIALTSTGDLLIADSDNFRIRILNSAGIITTVVGGAESNNSVGGSPNLSVRLGYMSGVAIDLSGNIFWGEPDVGRIRKMTPAGIVTTVAGNERSLSFGGDMGPASAALLNHPWGISFDAVGNLYIADTENNRIRMVSPDGTITTFAGTGTSGFDGDAGPATFAQFARPRAVASDEVGNIFIADTLNHRIRKVSSGSFGKVITTVAGDGTRGFYGDGGASVAAQLSDPSGVAVDRAGNLFIADTGNNRIRKVTSDGIITTVVGTTPGFTGDGSPATAALLSSPSAVALDTTGNLFITDSGSNRIRKVTPAGMISTIAGTGTAGFSGDGGIATAAQLSLVGSSETRSTGLVVDTIGNVYFADTGNQRIRRVSRGGFITTVAGSGVRGFSGDSGQPAVAQFFNPSGIALDAIGSVLISDTFNNRVRKLTSASETTFTIPDRGGTSLQSSGSSTEPAAGYASIRPDNASETPAGLAILGLRQNNVLISEAAVLASPLIRSGRFYVEVTDAVNTGIAIANPNNETAIISFFFHSVYADFGHGTIDIPANGKIAQFLNESPFRASPPVIGTFTFSSSVPVSAVALRGLTNERSEFLITTMPVVELGFQPFTGTVVLPHFAAGGNWTSDVILFNPTDTPLTGTIQYLNPSGQAAAMMMPSTDGFNAPQAAPLSYVIAPRSTFKFPICGSAPSALVTGSIRVVPGNNTASPSGFVIASLHNRELCKDPWVWTTTEAEDSVVTEAAIPAVPGGSAFRLYADVLESIQTGIVVANDSDSITNVTLELTRLDGSSAGLTGTLTVPARGQVAVFLKEIPGFGALGTPVQGVLRLASPSPISVVGLRGRYNERNDFLITTTPAVDENTVVSNSPTYFPHIADSGGYTTQLILFNARRSSSASGKILFLSPEGRPWEMIFR